VNRPEFIIIYDTYCGWCYGAAPFFDALVASGATVQALHRHLFQGPRVMRMDDGNREHVLKADAQIASLTGQVFSRAYMDNVVLSKTEILESKYSAHAAALVHDQGVEKEFLLRARLERARYVNGVSAQNRESVVDTLIGLGIAPEQANRVGSAGLAAKANAIAQRATDLMDTVGARGVPAVLRASEDGPIGYELIDHTIYYGSPERASELVDDAIFNNS